MERLKVIKKINNLTKVKAIVEIAKANTLSKISKSNKIKNHHYKMAKISQEIINFSKKNNLTQNDREGIKNKFKKTLWVFITIPQKLLKTSYAQYEKILKENIVVEHDAVIAVGDPAIKFVKKEHYNLLAAFDEINNSSDNVASIVMGSLMNGSYENVNVISHNNNSIEASNYLQLFPFPKLKTIKEDMKKMKFYYSLSDNIHQISFNYIKNMVFAIYQETYRNFYIEKLAKHESSLKSIEEKILTLRMTQAKEERKSETEEMIQVIQSVKRS